MVAKKVTADVPVCEVQIEHDNGLTETFGTTAEHPFYIDGLGWRKASVLEAGMILLDRHGKSTAKVIRQQRKDCTETVYNIEVQDFHTYHIGSKTMFDTNQTARPGHMADPNKPTLIAEDILRQNRKGRNIPNTNMANAHAEVALIQRAYDQGLTQCKDMIIVVRGKAVCDFCETHTKKMADKSGLNSLIIINTGAENKSPKIIQWNREK